MIARNGQKPSGFVKDNISMVGMAKDNQVIFSSKPKIKIVTFADGTDEEIASMLDAHYQDIINIGDYWHVGDTRVMHLNAMAAGTGANEKHVAQNMTMIIIGIEHDDLKEQMGTRKKAAITLQCREVLGNNGSHENGYNGGCSGQWSANPRRTWLNNTFVGALPNVIQPLVKTVIKKNLANHTDDTPGISTEDKAFFTSYPEMFGSTSYGYYKGSPALEGEQYPYYDSNTKRIKYINKNGSAGNITNYWLRSPSSDSNFCCIVNPDGTANYSSGYFLCGIAPAFCL